MLEALIDKMDLKDWLTVLAALLGPILAVQAQKMVEMLRAHKERKYRIFTQLMATRAARLSGDHVQSLNMIDLVFYGRVFLGFKFRSAEEEAVLEAWREYHDNLATGHDFTEGQLHAHWAKRDELFTNLLFSIAKDVNFKFDRVQLKRGAYSPMGHEEIDREQRELRQSLLKTFSGKSSLNMNVMTMPSDEKISEEYRRNFARIADALEAKVKNPD